ncbi:MAG TPA: lipopolysaccharide kinase InaA family protein [Anaerohalosphaeraceae bacterium]|nr:lipopolysaccharide kinase InaA family protein [Anaerohalosphaeraceae bacterium]
MERINYANSWQPFFEEAGLRTFDDFFQRFEGTQINKNTKRSVVMRTFERAGGTKTLFMKRFFNPHVKDMLFAVRNWGGLCSQGQLEWNSANYLLEHGIATYQPACFGHRTLAGIERQSFFITEQLAGQCLMDMIRQTWRTLGGVEQNRLLGELAMWIQGIHRLNISLPDLYVYHLFVDKDGDGRYGFSVIDLHRMSVGIPQRRMAACRVENLARLIFSMRDEYFTASQKQMLLRTSLSDLPDEQVHKMLDAISRRCGQIGKRRRPPAY